MIPKALRDELGFVAGEVEVTAYDATLYVECVKTDLLTDSDLKELDDGSLVIPSRGGPPITDEDVRRMRFADQR